MNSLFSCSKLAAMAACGSLLMACNSVKDVRDDPFAALPEVQSVLAGSIMGLGSARAVALSYDGAENCAAPNPVNPAEFLPTDCKFFGLAGAEESHFSFGSLDTGTAYTITVKDQPYGKICTVANASGTVGAAAAAPVVNCADDPAVPRHDLTVNISAAMQALPNLTLKLQTEEDILSMDATGQTSVVFPGVLFDSGSNLPLFAYQLTATTDTTAGGQTTTNYCTFVQSASFSEGGRNINATGSAFAPPTDATIVPTGPVTVTTNTCEFTVTVAVNYNGSPALTMPAGGMTLALRNHFTGVDEETLQVDAFTSPGSGPFPVPGLVSFANPLRANARSIYELVVTNQPDGMHCVVAGSTTIVSDTASTTAGINTAVTASTGSAVLLLDPSLSDWWAYLYRQVRCRAVPAPENRLTGTYQMDARVGNQPNTDPPRPYGRPREFLTFFDDGTFLFGINTNTASTSANSPNSTFPAGGAIRNNWAAGAGVAHGFYAYNSAAGTITFTVFTTTVTNPSTTSTNGRGLTGMPGYTQASTYGPGFIRTLYTGTITATGVVKTAPPDSTLTMTFTSGSNTRLWTMTEPASIDGEITGTWVTADHRRAFAYDEGYTYSFHMGVNGMGNLQDVCLLPTDGSTSSAGQITRHSGSATTTGFVYTCTLGVINPGTAFVFSRNVDLPHYAARNSAPNFLGIGPTAPRIAPGFNGRFPGTAAQLDNRPQSPVDFMVTAGAPDTLVVQETLNGTPINQPITFHRERAN